jgi:pimeloyl-ACP methyl ester carboxylesterase
VAHERLSAGQALARQRALSDYRVDGYIPCDGGSDLKWSHENMPYLELPGVHLWYTDSGSDGVPVVFMHAASGTSESWVYQLPAFTAAGYRCITYDRRGWGRSRPEPTGEQPGYVTDDLHGLVDHLGLDRFHLATTAAGGIGGLDYAVEHPERVRSLVVADSIGGVQDPEYLEVQHRLRPPEIQALPWELRELSAGYRGMNPEGTRRWIEIEHGNRPEGAQGPGQPPRHPMTFTRLETLRVPTLALVGEADLLSPPALMRLLAAHISHCQLATVPEAGHAAHWEQPGIWNRIVLEFIGQH